MMHNIVSEWVFVLLTFIVFATAGFILLMWRKGNIGLIHKVYFVLSAITIVWLIAIMSLIFIREDDMTGSWVIDSITNIGAFLPVLVLLIAFVFIKGWTQFPKWIWLLFIIPVITQLMVWTNPLHGFYYETFSLKPSEVVFGWYFYLHSAYTSVCTLLASFLVLKFAFTNKIKLYMRQGLLFAIGNVIPLAVNLVIVNNLIPGLDSTIVTTPLSYIFGVVLLHGLAIFKFHMLDIKPMAVQTVLNWISDGYLVINENLLVVSYNQAFAETFSHEYGIKENAGLKSVRGDVVIHTLISSIESCRASNTTISYEQSVLTQAESGFTKKYYMVDITPLNTDGKLMGFVVFFKDITKVKESMQKLQQSQNQMLERDRLASLGQMVGSIAHNLKTPIMGVAGSAASINALIHESEASLGDPEVTTDDYREILDEMSGWTKRITEACSYMSDIITAVKGQAASLSTTNAGEFSISDLFKRVSLLLRHELMQGRCTLEYQSDIDTEIFIHGDINNLVQVVNNLVVNAIDSMQTKDGGKIKMDVAADDENLYIKVIDNGTGISEDVKKLLFHQMVTDKGAMGTGLGVFMSNTSIKANFGGRMWFEDNPEGGTIFGIAIPLEHVSIGEEIFADDEDDDEDDDSDDIGEIGLNEKE